MKKSTCSIGLHSLIICTQKWAFLWRVCDLLSTLLCICCKTGIPKLRPWAIGGSSLSSPELLESQPHPPSVLERNSFSCRLRPFSIFPLADFIQGWFHGTCWEGTALGWFFSVILLYLAHCIFKTCTELAIHPFPVCLSLTDCDGELVPSPWTFCIWMPVEDSTVSQAMWMKSEFPTDYWGLSRICQLVISWSTRHCASQGVTKTCVPSLFLAQSRRGHQAYHPSLDGPGTAVSPACSTLCWAPLPRSVAGATCVLWDWS